MKHYILISILCMLMPFTASADVNDVLIDGIYYNLKANTMTAEVSPGPTYKTEGGAVIRSHYYKGNVVIPESVTYESITYSVTSIKGGDACDGSAWQVIAAFYKCSDLTDVTIPNSVISIGSCAFYECSSLTSITISNGLITIGGWAFSGCTGLTSIDIPNSVNTLGGAAFKGCSGLTSVFIGNGITSCGSDAFDGCSNIKYASINSAAAMNILDNTESIEKISLGNDITKIECSYIAGHKSLKSITIGNSVSEIGERAFANLDNLAKFTCSSVNVPNTNRTAFENSYIDYVTLYVPAESVDKYKSVAPWSGFKEIVAIEESPSEPETIIINGISYELNGSNATIMSCNKSLSSSITIPSLIQYNGKEYSVTAINHKAFADCNGLTSVTIPNSITYIGDRAFDNCKNLTSITIPNSVTHIGSCAFYYCSGLTSVTLPNSLELIDACTFEGCSSLTSVTIPNSVTCIGEYAFQNSGLTSVSIPNSITSIKEHAFTGCSGLSSISIGNSVKSIGSVAFANCEKLSDVTCYATTVPTAESDAFDNSNTNDASLYVPAESVNDYKSTTPWNLFMSVVAIGTKKCDTPTIEYKNGYFFFDCETEGVEYNYNITVADVKEGKAEAVKINFMYTMTVYASKEGYEDSDVATYEFDIRGLKGDVNADGEVNVGDIVTVTNIMMGKE